NQRRGFHFHNGEDSTTVVQALTIQNGFVADSLEEVYGGAILCRESSPSILDCVFSNNTAVLGGALGCRESSPDIVDCAFRGNLAVMGGALACSSATPKLLQCLFTENTADSLGGGVFLFESSAPMEFCVLDSNTAAWGGAIALEASSPAITNCTLAHNWAVNTGGGLHCSDSSPTVTKCIIVFSSSGEGMACSGVSDPVFACCDVFGNDGGNTLCGTDGGDNISLHPRFCDADSEDLTLADNSPCAPANSPCGELIGAGETGCGPHDLSVIVKPDGTGDYTDIQTAIDAVYDEYTIALTNGVFTGEGNRNLDFGGRGLLLTSVSGDRDSCIIDCEGDTLNPCRGFHFHNDEDSTAIVQALTIQNGFVSDSLDQISGGAILCRGASPSIVDCVFRNNTAILGGALACSSATPDVSLCLFTENVADSLGGAIHLLKSSAPMEFCVLDSNAAAWGGAISMEESSPEITNCTLYGNGTVSAGGGLYLNKNASPVLTHVIISYSVVGEAVFCEDSEGPCEPVFTCCDVYGNEGGDWTTRIDDQSNVNGNFSLEPYFCDAENGDFQLWNFTPCVSVTCGQVGAFGIGCMDVQEAPPEQVVGVLRLDRCRPNPTSGFAQISFHLPAGALGSVATLEVFDPNGRRVQTLLQAPQVPGEHIVIWDGTDRSGSPASSGIYYYRLKLGAESITRPLVLLR
ncbi:right-handed parallel beta-helix repeat-containing protein, partial [Candidatus Eisenbacteria bacterium]